MLWAKVEDGERCRCHVIGARIKAVTKPMSAMRHDGGGQAMLAQRRAQRRADEEAMAEAVRNRPAGDDTPLRPPGADEPVGLQFDVAWLLEEPSEDERRFQGRGARRARRGWGATVVEEGVGVEHAAGGHVLAEEVDDEMLLLEELMCDDEVGDADGGPPRRSIFQALAACEQEEVVGIQVLDRGVEGAAHELGTGGGGMPVWKEPAALRPLESAVAEAADAAAMAAAAAAIGGTGATLHRLHDAVVRAPSAVRGADEARPPPTLKTKIFVRGVDNLYAKFLASRRRDGAPEDADAAPGSALFNKFGVWLTLTRCKRSLTDMKRLGRGKVVILNFLELFADFIVPARYPAWWASHSKLELSVVKKDLRTRTWELFTQEGRTRLANACAAEERGRLEEQGVAPAEVHARAEALRRSMVESIDAQTGSPLTAAHLFLPDIELVEDVLLSEAIRVNEAIVLDGFVALAEQLAPRPGMVTNDKYDVCDDLSVWHGRAPLRRCDVQFHPDGLEEPVMIGGMPARGHVEVSFGRAKGHYFEQRQYVACSNRIDCA